MIKNIIIFILMTLLGVISWLYYSQITQQKDTFQLDIVFDFDSCMDGGGSIIDVVPRQCQYASAVFFENSDNNNDNVVPSGTVSGSKEELLGLIGLPENDARVFAASFNRQFLITEEDGISYVATFDSVNGRIKAVMEKGLVVDYTIE